MKLGFDAKRFFHNKTGLGNYSRDLIRILAQFHPENSYLLYNPKPKKIDRILIDGKIIIEHLPETKKDKKFSSVWRLISVCSQIKKDKVDLYHGLSGEIPIGLNNSGVKTVVTIHDLIFMRYPNLYSFFDRKIHYYKFKYAANNADLVIAISEQTKKDIVTYLKINPEKIKVIYQGCAPVFKEEIPIEFIELTRNKYQLPTHFILNVGTIEKRKNVLSVIKAIKEIDTQLVVIGKKTDYFKEVNNYIVENNIQNKVIFLENVELKELASIYRMASVFIYPSVFEGFGIPIIEALYSKTPVITSKGGCFSEAGGENSVYINALNYKEIKGELEELLANSEKRELMKQKGFEFVQKFNDDIIAKNWVETYNEVVRLY
ncbi:MAG: glycosyltransferase family 1 protein [Flavobacterium sp.]|jgi:glycosyltransferase involved in cell wall biosynthesis|nr:glycosyltransferase family 1 protein [Flavobacterium sp.]